MTTTAWAIPILLIAAGCANDPEPPPPPKRCFVGDASSPVEIEPVFRDADGTMHAITEGGEVPLILPPQGGKVMFIGVRAKNLDGCPITISTAIRDVCTDAVIALERRPVELVETEDGWLEPLQPTELSNYSNLPACPRANVDRDIQGQPYELIIQVEDKDGRTAEIVRTIVPVCNEAEFLDRCLCECSERYRLGDECMGEPPDAGTSTSSACPTRDGG